MCLLTRKHPLVDLQKARLTKQEGTRQYTREETMAWTREELTKHGFQNSNPTPNTTHRPRPAAIPM